MSLTIKKNSLYIRKNGTLVPVDVIGGSSEAFEALSEKASRLNNESTDVQTFNLLNPTVAEYLATEDYDSDDYSYTYVTDYSDSHYYRMDTPQPVIIRWQHSEDAVETFVSINTDYRVLNTGMKQYDATGKDKLAIFNLLPNTTYYYKVYHLMPNGTQVKAKEGSFATANQHRRMIFVDGIQNVRDIGGYVGLDGKTVKYGMLLRGSAMDESSQNMLLIADNGKAEMIRFLGIRCDLDLRANKTKSAIADDMEFLCGNYEQYVTAITSATARGKFKTVFDWILARLSETKPKPIYFHCQGGCDRTGTLAFQLLGLLGVSESDLAKEYELSSFSTIGKKTRTRNSTGYNYKGMVAAIKEYEGDTLTDKFVSYALDCGITSTAIDSFRNIMLV